MRPKHPSHRNIALAVHGGAGVMTRDKMKPAAEARYLKKLEEALLKGWERLRHGESALDAVCAAVRILEDSPLFNAGRGSVLTHDGTIEMDAAIMDGSTSAAGAVACVKTIKNPIMAARAVMDRSAHVLLVGAGAESFAQRNGLKIVDPAYFRTKHQWKLLQDALAREKRHQSGEKRLPTKKFGTVGAVGVDSGGHLAAATSTGGMFNKQFGRVGDSPVIGAGTYADDDTCAVSATGHGEYFIRAVAAYDVAARMKYAGQALKPAALGTIAGIGGAGGEGGLIALTRRGQCIMPFNSAGMFRGCITRDGEVFVAIYQD